LYGCMVVWLYGNYLVLENQPNHLTTKPPHYRFFHSPNPHKMSEKNTIKHIISKDGSSTLFAPDFDEHYHSIHGAIQESMHVFLGAGLDQIGKKEISILEMGFGTGLNALLTAFHATGKEISYTSLEAYPVASHLIEELNYAEQIGGNASELFSIIHQLPWEAFGTVHPAFSLKKVQVFLEHFETEARFDLVYYDAFAPSSQANLWTEEIFRKLHGLMNPGAALVTYCAKGDVRRAMIAAGFQIEKIPGPPGKREMLRGWKR